MGRVIGYRSGQDRNEPDTLSHTYAITAAGNLWPMCGYGWNRSNESPSSAAGAFVRLRPVGWMGGAMNGPRIGSSERRRKVRFGLPRVSHSRLPSEVSGLQHFHSLVSPATFPPTECLMAPASYVRVRPAAVMSTARGPRSPFVMASWGTGSCFDVGSHYSSARDQGPSKQSLALARKGRGEMPRGQRRADRTGESASATWANKATALICRRSTSRHVRQRNCTFCPVFAPCAGYVTVAGE